jgi:hypothetical protein
MITFGEGCKGYGEELMVIRRINVSVVKSLGNESLFTSLVIPIVSNNVGFVTVVELTELIHGSEDDELLEVILNSNSLEETRKTMSNI